MPQAYSVLAAREFGSMLLQAGQLVGPSSKGLLQAFKLQLVALSLRRLRPEPHLQLGDLRL